MVPIHIADNEDLTIINAFDNLLTSNSKYARKIKPPSFIIQIMITTHAYMEIKSQMCT